MLTRTVLVVDDDRNTLQSLEFILSAAGFNVKTAESAPDALAILRGTIGTDRPVEFLITDIQMPVYSGLDFIDAVHRIPLDVPILVVTGYRDRALQNALQHRGCLDFLDKPLDEETLLARIELLLGRNRAPSSELINHS